jgi:hypothetical protein
MRSLVCFLGIAFLHFILSMAGLVLALRAGFAVQGGQLWAGFLKEPIAVTLAYLSEALLAPLGLIRFILPTGWCGGYAEIMVVSILFGAVAVGILHLSRAFRSRRAKSGVGDQGDGDG